MKIELKGSQYYCTSPRMYAYMVENGVKPSLILPHFRNPDYCVWMFDLTPEARTLIEDYYECYLVREEGNDNRK